VEAPTEENINQSLDVIVSGIIKQTLNAIPEYTYSDSFVSRHL